MLFNTHRDDGGVVWMYETQELRDLYHKLQVTVDPVEREKVLIDIGEHQVLPA